MAGPEPQGPPSGPRIPWQPVLLDDIFLMLMAGLVFPTLVYIVWGLMSIGQVPLFTR